MKNRKKIVVLGSAGNLGMYFIDYLLNNLDLNKYEIIATGTKAQYPFEFYKGKYNRIVHISKEALNYYLYQPFNENIVPKFKKLLNYFLQYDKNNTKKNIINYIINIIYL